MTNDPLNGNAAEKAEELVRGQLVKIPIRHTVLELLIDELGFDPEIFHENLSDMELIALALVQIAESLNDKADKDHGHSF